MNFKKYMVASFMVIAFLSVCKSQTKLVEPGNRISKDACLVLFGLVELTGATSIGARKEFDYRVYESSYLRLIDMSQNTVGKSYTPQFKSMGQDSNGIGFVVDKVVDGKSIYYAFTGLEPGNSYAISQIGYTKTETYKVGNQTYTRSIPVYIRGDAVENFKKFPIHCKPRQADFLGIAGVRVYGGSFSMEGDVLPSIQDKAENSDLDYFFGPYENTKKGAAWFIRDRLFETQNTGYWHELLKPKESLAPEKISDK